MQSGSTVHLMCVLFPATAHPGLVDKRTLQEQTALLLAVSCEHLSCARCLLEGGADPDISSKNKETPLYKGQWWSPQRKRPHKSEHASPPGFDLMAISGRVCVPQPVSWTTWTW